MDPSHPVSALPRDRATWPSAPEQRHVPYGMPLDTNLLGQVYNLWSNDFGRQVGLTAIPYGFMFAVVFVLGIAFFLTGSAMGEESVALYVVMGGVSLVAMGLMIGLFVAGQAGAFLALEEAARGERRDLTVMGAIGAGWPSFGKLAGSYLIMGVLATVVLVPGLTMLVVGLEEEMMGVMLAGCGLGFAGFILFMIGAVRFVATGPVAVLEERSPIDAMKRSWELTSGRGFDVFVVVFVFGLVLGAINMVVAIVGLIPLLGALVQMASTVLLGSVQTAFTFSMYAALKDAKQE